MLIDYSWPGNIRELENAIEYAFARSKDVNIIQTCKLPSPIREGHPCYGNSITKRPNNNQDQELKKLLQKHHWNKTKVAEELGIGRTTLWRILKNLKIEADG